MTTLKSYEKNYVEGLKALVNISKKQHDNFLQFQIVNDFYYITNGKIVIELHKDIFKSIIKYLPQTFYKWYFEMKENDNIYKSIDDIIKTPEGNSFCHLTNMMHEHTTWYEKKTYRIATVTTKETTEKSYVYFDNEYIKIMQLFLDNDRIAIIGKKNKIIYSYLAVNEIGAKCLILPISTSSNEIKENIVKELF